MASSDCLLPRAIPLPPTSNSNQHSAKAFAGDELIDSLAAKLGSAIKLDVVGANKPEKAGTNKVVRKERAEQMSPADHLALQSLRCSGKARKTNTTSKFNRDCRNLFTDLLSMNGQDQREKEVKKEQEKTDNKKPVKATDKGEVEGNGTKKSEVVDGVEEGKENNKPAKEEEEKEEDRQNDKKENTKMGAIGNKPIGDADDQQKEKQEEQSEEQEKNKTKGTTTTTTNDGCCVDGQLIARGPLRANHIGANHMVAPHPFHHPYGGGTGAAHCTAPLPPSAPQPMAPFIVGAAAAAVPPPQQQTMLLLNAAGTNNNNNHHGHHVYEWGLPPPPASNWSGWSSCGGHDSMLSSPSSTPDTVGVLMSPGRRSVRNELPDELSDFILEYSRRYSPTLSRKQSYSDEGGNGSPRSFSSSSSSAADSPASFSSHQNGGIGHGSPLSAPQSSPAAPIRSGAIEGRQTTGATIEQTQLLAGAPMVDGMGPRRAKERLRNMIRSEDMDDAWAWTCKCIARHPGALTFQDGDRDTLLHIVTSHLDLAKIYALVEQMLKSELTLEGGMLPFDIPNGMGETPLMLAVQKGQCEVVDYLLEAGASPNVQSTRLERDMPLHYAATRGMAACVRTLCADPRTQLDAPNGMGLSPLLCAFKSHGVLEEESQRPVCSLEVAECLLKAAANPGSVDATNGRTLLHYAVERGDERMIELLQAHVDEVSLVQLVNQPDFCGESPMGTLEGIGATSMDQRTSDPADRICLALLTCGAHATASSNLLLPEV